MNSLVYCQTKKFTFCSIVSQTLLQLLELKTTKKESGLHAFAGNENLTP
jgi:hypothetical protein